MLPNQIASDFINGNLSDVIKALGQLTPMQAANATLQTYLILTELGQTGNANSFANFLNKHAD